jgi:hypothetical protein
MVHLVFAIIKTRLIDPRLECQFANTMMGVGCSRLYVLSKLS